MRILDTMGNNATEGLVEICVGGRWGTVCGTSRDNRDASIVCQQLGLETSSTILPFFLREQIHIYM